jgi:hypothetical protein
MLPSEICCSTLARSAAIAISTRTAAVAFGGGESSTAKAAVAINAELAKIVIIAKHSTPRNRVGVTTNMCRELGSGLRRRLVTNGLLTGRPTQDFTDRGVVTVDQPIDHGRELEPNDLPHPAGHALDTGEQLPAMPPQPSWRMRARRSRIGISHRPPVVCASRRVG